MNLSRPFIERPIATVLLTLGIALAGIACSLGLSYVFINLMGSVI